jgi:hypothetical protein
LEGAGGDQLAVRGTEQLKALDSETEQRVAGFNPKSDIEPQIALNSRILKRLRKPFTRYCFVHILVREI